MYAKDKTTIIDQRELLAIKVKSLAAEARIIRAAERKTSGALRVSMYQHRIGVVRYESRAACMALGFIKGRTLSEMEPGHKWDELPEMLKKKVQALITKYGKANFEFALVPSEARQLKQARAKVRLEMDVKERAKFKVRAAQEGKERAKELA